MTVVLNAEFGESEQSVKWVRQTDLCVTQCVTHIIFEANIFLSFFSYLLFNKEGKR